MVLNRLGKGDPLVRFEYSQRSPTEDMTHLLTACRATRETRERIIPDLLNAISLHDPSNHLLQSQNSSCLSQFILDPTSLNLPLTIRIGPNHPALPHILPICRNLCFSLHKVRSSIMTVFKTRQRNICMIHLLLVFPYHN